ncbi:MAG: hypothetical protein ACOCRX_01610 [Candidatus Woesearchaeota archaeon]
MDYLSKYLKDKKIKKKGLIKNIVDISKINENNFNDLVDNIDDKLIEYLEDHNEWKD